MAKKKATKMTAAKKAPAKKAPAKKKAAPKKAPAKKKAAPKKAPAKKRAAPKKAAAKKSATRKPATRKSTAKAKPAAKGKAAKAKATRKKATVKKTTAKKAAPKKTTAKKAPAKKAAPKKAAAKKAPAKKAAPTKAAPKKAAAKKAPAKKAAAKKAATSTPPAPAKAPEKVKFERSATHLPNKGVLIRLKRTGANYDHAGREKLRTVAAVEKSKGENPINLHHRKPSAKEREMLRQLLLDRRTSLMNSVKDLEGHAFNEETAHVSTNHLADSSSDQYDQEFTLSIMESETEELKEISRALEKIEGGTYGECEACGVDISIERLTAMPFTRICIHCRSKFEEEGGGEEFGVYPEHRV